MRRRSSPSRAAVTTTAVRRYFVGRIYASEGRIVAELISAADAPSVVDAADLRLHDDVIDVVADLLLKVTRENQATDDDSTADDAGAA